MSGIKYLRRCTPFGDYQMIKSKNELFVHLRINSATGGDLVVTFDKTELERLIKDISLMAEGMRSELE